MIWVLYLYLVDCNSYNSRTRETGMEVVEMTDNNGDSSANWSHDLTCDLPFPPKLVVSSVAYLELLLVSDLLRRQVANMSQLHF